jgi:glycosyltransferase involved in cell wall biosynthesis
MKKPLVQVLLSTYDGLSYLEEQLVSLFSQQGVEVRVLVRDDGSKDGTPAFLEDYAKRESRLTVLKDRNLGVVGSFFDLLRRAPSDADFYAFCDQDDVWLEDKLERATKMLSQLPSARPRLYCSRLRYVDKELLDIGMSRLPKHFDFSSALVENVATGCTIVFDRRLLETARLGLHDRHCLMHDWWLYLLAQGSGTSVFDPEPRVLYRQHGGNVVGASAGLVSRYLTKFRRFMERGADASHITDQAASFVEAYRAVLDPEKRRLALDFLASKRGFSKRIAWALALPTRRHSWVDNFILRILIVLNRY